MLLFIFSKLILCVFLGVEDNDSILIEVFSMFKQVNLGSPFATL